MLFDLHLLSVFGDAVDEQSALHLQHKNVALRNPDNRAKELLLVICRRDVLRDRETSTIKMKLLIFITHSYHTS